MKDIYFNKLKKKAEEFSKIARNTYFIPVEKIQISMMYSDDSTYGDLYLKKNKTIVANLNFNLLNKMKHRYIKDVFTKLFIDFICKETYGKEVPFRTLEWNNVAKRFNFNDKNISVFDEINNFQYKCECKEYGFNIHKHFEMTLKKRNCITCGTPILFIREEYKNSTIKIS